MNPRARGRRRGAPATLTRANLLSFSVVTDNTSLFDRLDIDYTGFDSTGTLNFTPATDASGVKSMEVAFRSPSGVAIRRGVGAFTPATSVTSTAPISFPALVEAGTWTVAAVILRDIAGNQLSMDTAALSNAGFPTNLAVVSGTDTAPPALTPSR